MYVYIYIYVYNIYRYVGKAFPEGIIHISIHAWNVELEGKAGGVENTSC